MLESRPQINVLCQQNRLAFASKTPGRTQHINFFGILTKDKTNLANLVDLPGYGYAQVDLKTKSHWNNLLFKLLANQAEFKGHGFDHGFSPRHD